MPLVAERLEEMIMFNELAKEIHQNAVEHGWWDEPRTFGEIVALCHSELSEALEECRADRPMEWKECFGKDPFDSKILWCGAPETQECYSLLKDKQCEYRGKKPEGIAVEMADCIIRILDWAGKEGLDMDAIIREKMDYNKTRPYRHGGKLL